MKVVFIRPPRHLIDAIEGQERCVIGLAYPCLAAYLRQKMPGIEVCIIDCPSTATGWRKLSRFIAGAKPDFVGIGEHYCFYDIGLRAFDLVKKIKPDCTTIAGGYAYSPLPRETLQRCPAVDFVVRWEGEETLVELLKSIGENGQLDSIRGLAFRRGGDVIVTPPRPTISNLDELPVPAYDLMGLDRMTNPHFLGMRPVPIQRGRGCTNTCVFCSQTLQEGDHDAGGEGFRAVYRSKSVGRAVEEFELLAGKYGVRHLIWTDATWNIDDSWIDMFCAEVMKLGHETWWWAFLRADLLAQQMREGILEKMIRAGLRIAFIGAERGNDADMKMLGKATAPVVETAELVRTIRARHPLLSINLSFITGMPDDDMDALWQLGDYAASTKADSVTFSPITPFPGTSAWREAVKAGTIDRHDPLFYKIFTGLMPTKHLSSRQLSFLTWRLQLRYFRRRGWTAVQGLFSRNPHRKLIHIWLLSVTLVSVVQSLFEALRYVSEMPFFSLLLRPGRRRDETR